MRTTTRITLPAVLALAAAAAATLPAHAAPDPVRGALASVVDDAGAPSVIARWGRDGRAASFRYGTARKGTRVPAVQGRFRAGSTTKTFTATVVLQLAEEGRLSLDARVESLLPGVVPGGASDITVRQLLNHTSGLAEFPDASFFDARGALKDPLRTWTPAELVAGIRSAPRAFDPPGSDYLYSQVNYVLLGMIIERAGGSYAREVERRIVRPLRLRDTYVPGTETAIRGPHNRGYVTDGTSYADVTALNPSILDAAGRIVSSTRDLAAFHRALETGRLLSPASLELMRTPSRHASYGSGLEVIPLKCGTFYGHGGGTPGYATLVASSRDGRTWFAASATLNGDAVWPRLSTALTAALCP
ncbi:MULTISPECIES: serine hydrolase domain-containing protein [Actinomadura]|uniref:Serine hydrolase domain-containing protein n=1 Tax=Actinomadura yumaensis TaxID=111807 RepID=A0ABW2CKL1_9ACTN|nr:serine hydrolase domain-containing protein [Actinomadura sp. J1-007]MWK36816.1 serine hydrolase [Actinomadura sp. J1-007]